MRRKAVPEIREERQRQGNPRTFKGKRLLRRVRSDGVTINMQVKWSVDVTERESDLLRGRSKGVCRGAGPEGKTQRVLNG